ncbi:MAG: hypothetical protein L3J23_02065 [Flavobacteriaceae bacterium]|nr:hypothetical protein [Flavobacteriaceae bacterium]
MNKLILYIICFLSFSCKNKIQQTVNNDNIKKTDTIFYTRNLVTQRLNQKINTDFDTTIVKKLSSDSSSTPFMQFSNNIVKDRNSFFNNMFLIDDSLDKIKFYNNTIELYFIQGDSISFYKNIAGDSSYWVFNHYMYHDLYNSLFTFSEINNIKIFIENKIEDQSNPAYNKKPHTANITFLPLSGDYEILLPNGLMKKKWYLKNTDYWDVFNDDLLDSSNSFIDKELSEIKEHTIDSIINNYKLKK